MNIQQIIHKEWEYGLNFIKPIVAWHKIKLEVKGLEHVRFHDYNAVSGGSERTSSNKIHKIFEGSLNHVLSEFTKLIGMNVFQSDNFKIEKETLSTISKKPIMELLFNEKLSKGQTEQRHFILKLVFSTR